jgi:hypothetical protein
MPLTTRTLGSDVICLTSISEYNRPTRQLPKSKAEQCQTRKHIQFEAPKRLQYSVEYTKDALATSQMLYDK